MKFIAHVQKFSTTRWDQIVHGQCRRVRRTHFRNGTVGRPSDWITIDSSEEERERLKAFMDRVGMPLYPALKRADDILHEYEIRDRMKLVAPESSSGPAAK